MAAIIVTTNFAHVTGQIEERLNKIRNVNYLLGPAADRIIVLIHPRIHVQGQASDGNQIGTYSKGYLAVRSGIFQNTHIITRGKNKGKAKGSGTFTEATIRLNKKTGVFTGEDKVGKPRINYNRGTDPKVIASLTREMESDYITVALPEEEAYGVGFSNQHNFDKSQFVENTYNKKIFSMTEQEETIITELIQDLINKALQE